MIGGSSCLTFKHSASLNPKNLKWVVGLPNSSVQMDMSFQNGLLCVATISDMDDRQKAPGYRSYTCVAIQLGRLLWNNVKGWYQRWQIPMTSCRFWRMYARLFIAKWPMISSFGTEQNLCLVPPCQISWLLTQIMHSLVCWLPRTVYLWCSYLNY